MLFKVLFLITIFIFSSSFSTEKEDELYLNYVAAINKHSTFYYHLVVKIKNINTNEVREICTSGGNIEWALINEYNMDIENIEMSVIDSLAKSNKKRYFEFKNKEAISNFGLFDYSMKELALLEHQINFDSLAKKIKKDKIWSKWIGDDKTLTMYAHALFNRGILTGASSCAGGTLYYIDRKKPIH